MPGDVAAPMALLLLAGVIGWPLLLAWQRRRESMEASAVAVELAEFARIVRRDNVCRPLEPGLEARVARLRMPELGAFRLAPTLPNATPELVSDAAMRFALRLKRRVAFDRKMLARTAPGRRRGAAAGALPPVVLLALAVADADFPLAAWVFVALADILGCWMLARFASVSP
jgi:hypothetical protein